MSVLVRYHVTLKVRLLRAVSRLSIMWLIYWRFYFWCFDVWRSCNGTSASKTRCDSSACWN